ncbi:gamma-glutamylcyclotransferase family protein [Roseivivax sp.]
MTTPFFFGYGSLVNQRTHENRPAHVARAAGWRRAWVAVEAHPLAVLTAVPAAGDEIEGLIAAVPGGDWEKLDQREAEYDRLDATSVVVHEVENLASIAIYSVPAATRTPAHAGRPILLSYLDVVLQGYLDMFGEAGAQRFFETTDGWGGTPILDDRATPRYPRAQRLTAGETAWVDAALAERGLKVTG